MRYGERVIKEHGWILLQHTMESLLHQSPGTEHYETRIFQALMLAGDCGFRRGIVTGPIVAGHFPAYAVIELPEGEVIFGIPRYEPAFVLPTPERQDERMRAFIAMGEDEEAQWPAPTKLHCDKCAGGSVVGTKVCTRPECECHAGT